MNRRSPDPGPPCTVTEDLLARFVASKVLPPAALVLTYVRAHHLAERDPREFVLRPTRTWTLAPGTTFGFGRAPREVDLAFPLEEEHGRFDPKVPRTAGRLTYRHGQWQLTNHASTPTAIRVSGPGFVQDLANTSAPFAVRSRHLLVTVYASSTAVGGSRDAVEHRFTILAPHIPDDVPTLVPALRLATQNKSVQPDPPRWSHDLRRLLCAWAYPELIGLPPRGIVRGRLTRRLLRQSPTGDDPNEKPLNTLRRAASRAAGLPMDGEQGTPAFLSYVVQNRWLLGQTLAELHAEYDADQPPP